MIDVTAVLLLFLELTGLRKLTELNIGTVKIKKSEYIDEVNIDLCGNAETGVEKKIIIMFFFQMFNGKDSHMFVVIVGLFVLNPISVFIFNGKIYSLCQNNSISKKKIFFFKIRF